MTRGDFERVRDTQIYGEMERLADRWIKKGRKRKTKERERKKEVGLDLDTELFFSRINWFSQDRALFSV